MQAAMLCGRCYGWIQAKAVSMYAVRSACCKHIASGCKHRSMASDCWMRCGSWTRVVREISAPGYNLIHSRCISHDLLPEFHQSTVMRFEVRRRLQLHNG